MKNWIGVSAVGFFLGAGSVLGFDYVWEGGTDSDWDTPSNWSTAVGPRTGTFGSDELNVRGGGAELVHTVAFGTTEYGGARGLVVGSTSDGTFRITGGTFSTFNAPFDPVVGNASGTGLFIVDGGTYVGSETVGVDLILGFASGGAGHFTVQNGGSASMRNIRPAQSGTSGTVTLSSGSLSVLNILAGSGTTVLNLDGGTLEANTITLTSGDSFNWGDGTLTTRTDGAQGSIDYSDNGFQPVQAGQVLNVTADVVTGASTTSALDLGGVYINSGARHNVLRVNGDLDLSSDSDVLRAIGSPYLLRPYGGDVIESGSIVLVDVNNGSLTGIFDTFIGPVNDGIGWSEYTGVFTTAAALPKNTWYLEQGGAGDTINFHYKVAGTVPEPSVMGLFGLGLLLARMVRKNDEEYT